MAKIITTTLARNGIRQPQANNSSRSRAKNITAQIAVALRVPQLVPMATSEEIMPRLPFGAYSASIVPAPEISAPAPSPCTIRSVTSRTGAKIPICAYVGSTPIKVVQIPIMVMVINSTFLRPMLSPILPNINAPTIRAIYPAPYVPIAKISAMAADCSGKNISWNTSAAPREYN